MLSCYQSSIIAHELHLRLLDVGCRDEVTIADDRQLIACDCASLCLTVPHCASLCLTPDTAFLSPPHQTCATCAASEQCSDIITLTMCAEGCKL